MRDREAPQSNQGSRVFRAMVEGLGSRVFNGGLGMGCGMLVWLGERASATTWVTRV